LKAEAFDNAGAEAKEGAVNRTKEAGEVYEALSSEYAAGLAAFRNALLEIYGGGKDLPDYKAFLDAIYTRLLAEESRSEHE
jgi:hypothetical protein